jgi:hypothetical protein
MIDFTTKLGTGLNAPSSKSEIHDYITRRHGKGGGLLPAISKFFYPSRRDKISPKKTMGNY